MQGPSLSQPSNHGSSISHSPDSIFAGFLESRPNPGRYDPATHHPEDSAYKIARLVPHGSRVLDVGCASGGLSVLIRDISSSNVIGIEPDITRAEIARSRGLEVHHGYLTKDLIAALGAFDVVVLADVLEHIPDPAKLVSLSLEALRPGGSIIVSVPNVAHWSVRLELLRGNFDYAVNGIMDVTHLRWFTHDSINKFFSLLNLEIRAIDFTVMSSLPAYTIYPPWKWMNIKTKRRLLAYLSSRLPTWFACQFIVQASMVKQT